MIKYRLVIGYGFKHWGIILIIIERRLIIDVVIEYWSLVLIIIKDGCLRSKRLMKWLTLKDVFRDQKLIIIWIRRIKRWLRLFFFLIKVNMMNFWMNNFMLMLMFVGGVVMTIMFVWNMRVRHMRHMFLHFMHNSFWSHNVWFANVWFISWTVASYYNTRVSWAVRTAGLGSWLPPLVLCCSFSCFPFSSESFSSLSFGLTSWTTDLAVEAFTGIGRASLDLSADGSLA